MQNLERNVNVEDDHENKQGIFYERRAIIQRGAIEHQQIIVVGFLFMFFTQETGLVSAQYFFNNPDERNTIQ